MTTTKKAEREVQAEIEAGAWTTPGGDPVVAVTESDEGNCAYCGDIIYGRWITTKSGMTQVAPGTCLVMRWFGKQLEPWHADCYERFNIRWCQAADGETIHRENCEHAPTGDDVRTFECTRGEARVIFDAPFCEVCAPIEFWVGTERIVQDCPTCDGRGSVAAVSGEVVE